MKIEILISILFCSLIGCVNRTQKSNTEVPISVESARFEEDSNPWGNDGKTPTYDICLCCE